MSISDFHKLLSQYESIMTKFYIIYKMPCRYLIKTSEDFLKFKWTNQEKYVLSKLVTDYK